MDAASKFGAEINNAFGWKCSVKEFDIEVVLRIDRNNVRSVYLQFYKMR